VAGTAFLDRLEPGSRELLRSVGSVRAYPARSFVMTEGDRDGPVVIVQEGLLKISKAASRGRTVVLALRGPGELVGELTALDHRGRSATVSTVVRSELLVIGAATFATLARSRPDIGEALLDLFADRLRTMSRQVVEMATGDAVGRVCGRLLELVEADDLEQAIRSDAGHDPIRLRLAISQEELAAWAGLSREAVVKAMRRMRDLGWIETGRRAVTIHDLRAVHSRSMQLSA
jgi:CRP/FNR family transcriptional regulator, cyclic AMP receptor protein